MCECVSSHLLLFFPIGTNKTAVYNESSVKMYLLRHFPNLKDQWLFNYNGILIITQISKTKEVPLQESAKDVAFRRSIKFTPQNSIRK